MGGERGGGGMMGEQRDRKTVLHCVILKVWPGGRTLEVSSTVQLTGSKLPSKRPPKREVLCSPAHYSLDGDSLAKSQAAENCCQTSYSITGRRGTPEPPVDVQHQKARCLPGDFPIDHKSRREFQRPASTPSASRLPWHPKTNAHYHRAVCGFPRARA